MEAKQGNLIFCMNGAAAGVKDGKVYVSVDSERIGPSLARWLAQRLIEAADRVEAGA